MYAYLDGTVAEKNQNELILDVMGVGWQLSCSMNTLQNVPPVGEHVKVYTLLLVREDAMELFGFYSREEKQMFSRLTSVSGIGPRTALGILSSMPLRDLQLAILTGDITALSRAPGVGKKTAQRIALELKERVSPEEMAASGVTVTVDSTVPEDGVSEAIMALQSLGYSASEAAKAVSAVKGQSAQADELIRLALRSMAGSL